MGQSFVKLVNIPSTLPCLMSFDTFVQKIEKQKRSQMVRRIFSTLALSTLIFTNGCFWFPSSRTVDIIERSYKLGEVREATVGSTIISVDHQKYKEVTEFVGIQHTPDGYRTTLHNDESSKYELLYMGRSGDTIKVTYREYYNDLARQPFFQELQYDLSQSSQITFRNHKIDVLNATNSSIEFIVRT